MNSFLVYFFVVFGLIAIIIILYDIYIAFSKWFARIHIGRWASDDEWKRAVDRVINHWLLHVPIVQPQERDRLLLFDRIFRTNQSSDIQYWQLAGLLLGCNDENSINSLLSHLFDGHGSWRLKPNSVEIGLLAYAVLCHVSPVSVKVAMDETFSYIMELKGVNDTIPYKKGQFDTRFVDTLGFVCPFLAKYAVAYKCEEAAQLAKRVFFDYDSYCLANWGFPSHAYSISLKAPLGIYDWGRGLGWYIIALICLFKETPQEDPSKLEFSNRIIRLANSVLLCQHEDGGFGSQLFIKGRPSEGSSTVLCGLLINEALNITNDERYLNALNKLLVRLKKMSQRNGRLDLCQGDTKAIGSYSAQLGYLPFAQGLLGLLLDETKHLKA